MSQVCCCFFFFFKQKTAYDMRISDWSSDVCSSDLLKRGLALRFLLDRKLDDQDRVLGGQADDRDDADVEIDVGGQSPRHRKKDRAKYAERHHQKQIGRASCRERVCPYG